MNAGTAPPPEERNDNVSFVLLRLPPVCKAYIAELSIALARRILELETRLLASWRATSPTESLGTSTLCTISGKRGFIPQVHRRHRSQARAKSVLSSRGPDGLKKLVGLATKKCTPCEGKDAKAMDSEQANKLRNQVPGWRLVQTAGGHLSLRQDWQARPGLSAVGQGVVSELCSVPSCVSSLQKPPS